MSAAHFEKFIAASVMAASFLSEANAACLSKLQARAKWPQAHLYWHTVTRSRCWDNNPKLIVIADAEEEPQALASAEAVELANVSWYPLPFSSSERVLLLQAADFYPVIPPSAESAREAIYAENEYNPLDAAADASAPFLTRPEPVLAQPDSSTETAWGVLLGMALTFFGVALPSTSKLFTALQKRLFRRRNQKARQAGGLSAILRDAEL